MPPASRLRRNRVPRASRLTLVSVGKNSGWRISSDTPDPACDRDDIPNEAREGDIQITVSNSLNFGGTRLRHIWSLRVTGTSGTGDAYFAQAHTQRGPTVNG